MNRYSLHVSVCLVGLLASAPSWSTPGKKVLPDASLSAGVPISCTATFPVAYRVGYVGVNKWKVATPGAVFLCVEHEVQSQRDWLALQKRFDGEGVEIVVMGINRVPANDYPPSPSTHAVPATERGAP